MVKCEEDGYSFRLSHYESSIYSDPGTVSSTYKQRIDSLFRDKMSQKMCAVQPPISAQEELEHIFGGKDERQRAFLDVRSAVQAQIERLFADAAKESHISVTHIKGPAPPPPKCVTPPPKNPTPPSIAPPPIHPSPPVSVSSAGSSGSSNSSVSPSATRSAIRPAVMKYKVDYLGATQLSEKATSLDVLQEPLKDLYYKYREKHPQNGDPMQGSFQITELGVRITHGGTEKAPFFDFTNPFPTIAVWAAVKLVVKKEDGLKYAFLPLICDPEAQDKYSLYHPLAVQDPQLLTGIQHPPMFACVMRKLGVPKVLECHGFICSSAEDAIVIAANLYQALLENMKKEEEEDSSTYYEDERNVFSDSEMVPTRPPRRKRTVGRSASKRGLRRANSEDILQSHIILDSRRESLKRLKRSVSDRNPNGIFGEGVDMYTKIAMPRSKSFMNVTSKYDIQELLNEVKKKTGLSTVDDILKQIVNSKGMSFSEMEPHQREILLKLAMTLSKDEIYQRSKSIMRKQQRSRLSQSNFDSDSDGSTITSVLKATKRSFSRLGSRASSLQSSYLKEKSPLKKIVKGKENRFKDSHQSTEALASLGSYRSNIPKTPVPKRIHSLSEDYVSCSECGYDSECSNKCYCSFPRRGQLPSVMKNKLKDIPSECDTESCVESEKCYCSLREKQCYLNSNNAGRIKYGSHSNISELGSCKPNWKSSVKSKSSFISDQERPFSPHRKKSISSNFSTDSDHSEKNRTSMGPRYLHQRRNGTRAMSVESLNDLPNGRLMRHPSGSIGSDGSHSSGSGEISSQTSRRSSGSQQKVLLVSAVDPTGKVVYRGVSQRQQSEGSDTASILSMKKTAEIAALFSELKLNQTTDLIDGEDSESSSEDDAYSSMQQPFMFSDNIETSLGYLP